MLILPLKTPAVHRFLQSGYHLLGGVAFVKAVHAALSRSGKGQLTVYYLLGRIAKKGFKPISVYNIYRIDFAENQLFKLLFIRSAKIFLDGSPQGKTAFMLQPYEGEKEYRGYPTMKDNEVIGAMEYAASRKIQLLAHCNGDGAAEQFLNCAEKAAERFPIIRNLRFVMIHAQFVTPSQLERAKGLGIIPSFFTAHSYYWGDTHIKNLGFERASRMSPAKSALEMGIPFTFHQDSPVTEPDMLESVKCAVRRVTKSGVKLDEGIPVFEAIKGVTASAAYQYGEETRKGTLEQGKNEDIVIMDKNPLEEEVSCLDAIKIAATVKSGKRVYSAE